MWHIIYKSITREFAMKKGNVEKTTIHHDKSLIPMEMRRSFEDALIRGIYKELHRRKMLSDGQLCALLETK